MEHILFNTIFFISIKHIISFIFTGKSFLIDCLTKSIQLKYGKECGSEKPQVQVSAPTGTC